MIARWIAAAVLFVAPALADDDFEVMRGDTTNTCTAQPTGNAFRPSGGVAVIDGIFALSIWTTGVDHGIPKGTYTATVQIDDKPPVKLTGTGSDGVYLLQFDIDFGMTLRSARTLKLNVRDKDYSFEATHMAEMMDAAASCANNPKLTDIYKARHAGTNGWELGARLPSGTCSAARRGNGADAVLIMMADGTLGLMTGHRDWNIAPDKFHATIRLDEKSWEFDISSPNGHSFSFFASPDNKEFFAALDHATTIKWHLPWTDADARIDGVTDIKARLLACTRNS